jgi:hypothetical protein
MLHSNPQDPSNDPSAIRTLPRTELIMAHESTKISPRADQS